MEVLLEYWQLALTSFLASVVGVLLALKLFPKIGLMDRPERYGLTRKPIPYYGGVMIFVVFAIMVFSFVPVGKSMLGLMMGAGLVALLGFLDDLLNLSPLLRLFVQFLAGLTLVLAGVYIFSINLPFFGVLDFTLWEIGRVPVLAAGFTILWVMAILNTMNFVDGVPGLSSGVSFIAGMTIFFLSTNPAIHENPESQVPVAMIALILAMCSLAFLLFDFPKPKILMGDSGSTFLGFVIATLAIFSGGKVATAFLVLGLPILDMLWVVARRFLSGQKVWKGDRKHLHHRFLDLGLSERKVVIIYLSITAVLGLSASSLVSGQQKFFMLIGLVIFMVVLALGLVFGPRRGV